jgi:hypothetical protein
MVRGDERKGKELGRVRTLALVRDERIGKKRNQILFSFLSLFFIRKEVDAAEWAAQTVARELPLLKGRREEKRGQINK